MHLSELYQELGQPNPNPGGVDWNLIDRHDESWHRAIRYAEQGQLLDLQDLIRDGLDVQGLFSPSTYGYARGDSPLPIHDRLDEEFHEDEGTRLSLMHVAAQHNQIAIMTLLSTCGADADCQFSFRGGWEELTPLCSALEYGHLEAVRWLLDAGAGVHWHGRHASTLAEAVVSTLWEGSEPEASYRRVQMLLLLVEHGIDLHRHGHYTGSCVMHYAIKNNQFDLVLELCNHGFSCEDSLKYSFDASTGSDDLLGLLILEGAPEFDAVFHLQGLPRKQRADAVWRMIDQKNWADHHRDEVEAALSRMINDRREQLVQILIMRGADINSMSTNGFTPLGFACNRNGRPELADWLITHGADVNLTMKHWRDTDDAAPLHLAMFWHQEQIANRLLDAGADVNLTCWGGTTTLMLLFRIFHSFHMRCDIWKIVDRLLEAGVDIRATREDGRTVLHELVGGQKTREQEDEQAAKIIERLVRRGADPAAVDKHGKMAIDYARALEAQSQSSAEGGYRCHTHELLIQALAKYTPEGRTSTAEPVIAIRHSFQEEREV